MSRDDAVRGAAGRSATVRGLTGAASLLMVLLACPRVLRAELIPPRGEIDGRVRAAAYTADQVYRLQGSVGYQIDLEFEQGESFVGIGAGDMDGIAWFNQDNHLFLKPKAVKVATNLTVLTNRRHYHIDYSATSVHSAVADPDAIFAVRFVYPEVQPAAEAARRVDADLGRAAARPARNLDYAYCGAPTLKPVRASDDGVHTRLRFAPNAELPAIFVRAEDDTESLINYSMSDGDVVIHRIARRFILRRGKLSGCIVNQSYSGSGERLESGTVTPEVERRVQGVVP
jgi:type IV secretion system protein VirB9